MRGLLTGEGAIKYVKDGEDSDDAEDIKLGIYSEGTFKQKSERLDKLGLKGFEGELGDKYL